MGIRLFHHKTWPFNICCPISFSINSWIVIGFGLDYIVNPYWKLDLDCQLHFFDGLGLDWQSKKIGLSNSLHITVISIKGNYLLFDCPITQTNVLYLINFTLFSKSLKILIHLLLNRWNYIRQDRQVECKCLESHYRRSLERHPRGSLLSKILVPR